MAVYDIIWHTYLMTKTNKICPTLHVPCMYNSVFKMSSSEKLWLCTQHQLLALNHRRLPNSYSLVIYNIGAHKGCCNALDEYGKSAR